MCWHGRSEASVFPHHLWPPVEPWRGYCLQRSGPGRYSNQHLPAAQTKWWGLRWVTPRSDCWAAGVGWERANSVGRGTNSQLARMWKQYDLDKLQNSHTQHHHQTRTFRAQSHAHTDRTITATVWTIPSITWLTELTNCPARIQFDGLVSYLLLSQARGSTVLWRQLLLLLASWLLSFLLRFHSSSELLFHPQRPPHMSWTYIEYNTTEEGILNPAYSRVNTQNQRTDRADKTPDTRTSSFFF